VRGLAAERDLRKNGGCHSHEHNFRSFTYVGIPESDQDRRSANFRRDRHHAILGHLVV